MSSDSKMETSYKPDDWPDERTRGDRRSDTDEREDQATVQAAREADSIQALKQKIEFEVRRPIVTLQLIFPQANAWPAIFRPHLQQPQRH